MGRCLAIALSIGSAMSLYGQNGELTPRDLYYGREAVGIPESRNRTSDANRAFRFGLRYNLLRVDRVTNDAVEVDPGFHFRTRDCFAVRMRPNRSGYLYVFNIGSSGAWQPLLPSPSAPGVSKHVAEGQEVLLPNGYCFEVEDPPGVETLLIVLSRTNQHLERLEDAIRNKYQPAQNHASADRVIAAVLKEIGAARSAAASDLSRRDLSIQKVGRPLSSNEPPNSMYVVQSSDSPGDRIVLSVTIHHE